MTKILVTGGAGMIGSNLVKRLARERSGEVRVVDNLWRGKREYLTGDDGFSEEELNEVLVEKDLRDPAVCREVVKGIDVVYHLADVVAGIRYVFANQAEVFHDNLIIDSNILKASAEAKVRRFLYVGTACSYPKGRQWGVGAPPLVEEDVLPADPESAYGWSKLMGELQTMTYGRETGTLTGVVRLHNVYGTPTDFSAEKSQVIPALIVKALRYPEEPFVVWGSGTQGRSFIHVDDVVEGLILAMDRGPDASPIQLGTDQCISIGDLATRIAAISGKQIRIQYDLDKPEGDRGRRADWRRAKTVLGWRPNVDLATGLERTYRWIESRMGRSRHSGDSVCGTPCLASVKPGVNQ
jgi:nucleoside-diphosphate-sugar epimerase